MVKVWDRCSQDYRYSIIITTWFQLMELSYLVIIMVTVRVTINVISGNDNTILV